MEILMILPLAYLIINVGYNMIFALASRLPSSKGSSTAHTLNRMAVMIPAYKEDEVIVDTAEKAMAHNYPKDKFDVYVLADQLQPETLQKLEATGAKVVVVSFKKSSKAKAINAGLKVMNGYEVAVVLDADNVMNDYFLHEINKTYNKGALAIQGQRIAKNEENNLAQLDAISEGINNNIFRKGHQNLGLSSALIGSGMAFDFQLFKTHMSAIQALGGFDKELELSLLKNKVRIAYVPEAEVYDEKVSDKKSFSNQRTRWIAAQIRFGIRSFRSGVARLITEGNIDYFDKVLQFLLLPRLILLGVLVISAVGAFFIHSTAFYILAVCLFTAINALIIATPAQYLSIRFLQLIASLPGIFFSMIVAIGGYKKAANNFLHTAHKSKTIS